MRVGKISASPSVLTRTESPSLSIPDNDPVGITSTLTIGSGPKIAKLRVKINELRHTWVGDLQAILTAPSGVSITLFDRPGNSFNGSRANDFINLVLDDSATDSIQNIEDAEIGPISGSYQPLQPLANFIGENSTGSWKLRLVDKGASDTGQLVSWSLEIFSYTCTSQNCPNPLAVTETGAIESGQICGTLANAIQTANQTASLANPVTVTLVINEVFFSNPPLAGLTINPGVIIYGGECSATPKMIYATGVAGNLTLEGGVTFKNIWVRSADGAQLLVTNNSIGVTNKFICSKITKT
jgi:subtilisin-like proprotein convertase family protein